VEVTITLCKHLQNELGDWHDTAVHRHMLARLAETLVIAEDPQHAESIDSLGGIIQAQGTACLERVRKILDRQGSALDAAVDTGYWTEPDPWDWK
jgi:CHAD domain-containing protein